MSKTTFLSLAFTATFAAVPALGGEILYFTNGTSMEIESHVIEDGIIQVRLGGQAMMAFSVEQVERIETARGEVAPLDRNGGSNQMVPTPTAAVQHGSVPRNYRGGGGAAEGPEARGQEQEDVDVDKNGIAVFRPFGRDAGPARRQIGLTGRRELTQGRPNQSGVANRVGARKVLPPGQGRQQQQPVGLAARGGTGGQSEKK